MQSNPNTTNNDIEEISVLDLIILPSQYKVFRNGEILPTAKLSFDLLMLFVKHPQQILTVEEISAEVWQHKTVSAETITQRIKLLRKALNDDPKNPKYIESVRGRGYKLIAKPQFHIESQPTTTRLKPILYFSIVCGLLISTLALFFVFNNENEKSSDAPINTVLERAHHYLDIGQQENVKRAIDLFRQVLDDNPEHEEALIGLSFALSQSVCRHNQTSQNAVEAREIASRAIKMNAKNSQSETALAYAWDCLGNLEKALSHYLKAIDLDGTNAKSIGSAAHLLQIKGALLESLKMSRRASNLDPQNPVAKMQIARALELLNFTSQARSQFQELFNLYPDNVFINEAYPRFLFYQSRFTSAKQHFEKAIERGASKDSLFKIYAELVWLIDGKEQAMIELENALKVNPDNTSTANLLSIITGKMQVSEGLKVIDIIEEEVIDGNTWPVNYIEAAIISLWVLKDENRAIDFLQKSVEQGFLDSEYLAISPFFVKLKDHSAFYKLIDKMNNTRNNLKLLYETE